METEIYFIVRTILRTQASQVMMEIISVSDEPNRIWIWNQIEILVQKQKKKI